MAKADYSKIASHYDKGRPLLHKNISLWMNLISSYIKFNPNTTILDLGCGTGRFAIPLASGLDLKVTGADSYQAMLDKAKAKDTDRLVKWEIQDADALTYPDQSFNYIFISHLLHHVNSPVRALSNCYKVLKNSGAVLIRYGAMEQIADDPEHKFFPGVTEIDESRTPSVNQVEKWLTVVGFTQVKSTKVVQKSYNDARSHYDATSHKGNSVLNMITPEQFSEGLKRFDEYIGEYPDDPWLVTDLLTLTVGYKN